MNTDPKRWQCLCPNKTLPLEKRACGRCKAKAPKTNDNFLDLQNRIFNVLYWADKQIECKGCNSYCNGSKGEHNPVCQMQHDLSASLGAHGMLGIVNPHPSVLSRSLEDILIAIKKVDGDKIHSDMTVVDFMIEEKGIWMENAYGNCTWEYGKTFNQQSCVVQAFVSEHLPNSL